MLLSEQVAALEKENKKNLQNIKALENEIAINKQLISLYESLVAGACATLKLIEKTKKDAN